MERKWLTMSAFNVNAVRCEALFVSALQASDAPTPAEVTQAIMRMVRELGSRGCAAQVAQEFGDHPESAVARMCWARQVVGATAAPTHQRTPEDRRAAVLGVHLAPTGSAAA